MNTVAIAVLATVVILVLACGVGWWCFRRPSSPVIRLAQVGKPPYKVQLIKANWCPHCRSMVPIFQELIKQSPSTYEIVDGPAKGGAWLKKNNIQAYPAIRLYRTDNSKPTIMYGAKTKQQILAL